MLLYNIIRAACNEKKCWQSCFVSGFELLVYDRPCSSLRLVYTGHAGILYAILTLVYDIIWAIYLEKMSFYMGVICLIFFIYISALGMVSPLINNSLNKIDFNKVKAQGIAGIEYCAGALAKHQAAILDKRQEANTSNGKKEENCVGSKAPLT